VTGVVVGVTRTGASGTAVRWASVEASVRALPLALVHAWSLPLDVTVALSPASMPDLLTGATSSAAQGRAGPVLLAQQADMLVLGAREGAPHASHLTRHLLHQATCPVVVVPDVARPLTGRVVVGVCGSETSRVALRWAAEEARLRGALLVAVHAWQVRPTCAWEVFDPDRAVPAQRAAALDRLRGWVRAVVDPSEVELHATHGGPLDGLLEVARDADVMVLGRGNHSGLGRWLHGAVGDDLSGLAPCPVAVIPGLPARANALV
jgi:nucleotide-binding universal stress UspA family protein